MNKKTAVTIIIALSFLVICAIVYCVFDTKQNLNDKNENKESKALITDNVEKVTLKEDKLKSEDEQTFIPEICVYLCGAVQKPGVYKLEVGKRLIDAVSLAGGLKEEASDSYQNLAGLLKDGMQYYFPTLEELKESGLESILLEEKEKKSEFPVNINQASKEDLTKIPGIGEAKAEKIILYREAFGKFENIDDLVKVSGIGENMLFQIRAYVCV